MLPKTFRVTLALGLLLCLITLSLPAEALVELQRKLQEQQRQFDQIQNNIEGTQQNLVDTTREIESLERQLTQIQRELDTTQRELARLEQEVSEAEIRVDDAREVLRQTEEELDYRTTLMNMRVRAMHERGPVRYIEVLLTARSFYEFMSRLELMRQIVRADVELFHYVYELRERAEAQRDLLEIELDYLAQLRDQTARKKEQLNAQIASRESTLTQVERRRAEYERRLAELERDSERVTEMLQKIQAEIEAYRRQGELVFLWPLNPRGWVSSPFGMRYHPILRQHRLHTGIDIAAPTGTSIIAAEEGRVVYSGWLGGYGLTVIIDHGGRVSTLYAHASQLLVSAGQIVSRGQLIARVGSTGLSTGPHLHFEVRRNGEPVDPRPLLP